MVFNINGPTSCRPLGLGAYDFVEHIDLRTNNSTSVLIDRMLVLYVTLVIGPKKVGVR